MVNGGRSSDAAPDYTFQSRYVFPAKAETMVITGLEKYFDNAEDDTLMYTVTSSNRSSKSFHDNIPWRDTDLTMDLAQGTATVTITATDARGQTVKAEFVVNGESADDVNSPSKLGLSTPGWATSRGFFWVRPAWALARRCGVRGACQVLYWPGRGNGESKARVSVVRRDLKEAGDKPLARRTGTA